MFIIFSDQIPLITINGKQTNDSVEVKEEDKEEDQTDGKQNTTIDESINEPSEIDPEQDMYDIFSFLSY